ncbi:thioesterase family protein [Thalassotalea sp. 1_MG-2023]|uniref:acyl-CoA thioesterase n=1 Tax=Thalassotalea sp. 1_MG-2023 TaxID=3062680 RepID=UPI0026E13406|nr:thioesterase family protein [Thalassotalea sp. 1_MG-2023]MDO6428158.1 thioesterase family protein [Thalassotalea sp. 1_MG-2023]
MANKFFHESFKPRFCDTDALGHINNTMIPIWFEGARNEVFKWFTPDLNLQKWRLILAKIDATFHGQMYYEYEMEVRTYIGRIGSSSFDVYQELWQQNELKASGTAVMVHFDYQTQKTAKIPTDIAGKMTEYLKN